MPTPTCWKCGYELRGLQVEDVCPECGTSIWSRPGLDSSQMHRDAGKALAWGVTSIVLLFVCLGPLAGLVAIPAITISSRLKRQRDGEWASDLGNARAAWWLGWITAGISIALVTLYAVLILFSVI